MIIFFSRLKFIFMIFMIDDIYDIIIIHVFKKKHSYMAVNE